MPSPSALAVAKYLNNNNMKVIEDTRIHINAPLESTNFREFTFFKKLPIELQAMIWKYTLPDPRVIRLEYYYKPSFTIAMSSTCRLAREIALQKYSFMVINENTAGHIDLTSDILFFDLTDYFEISYHEHSEEDRYCGFPIIQVGKIRHLAIDSPGYIKGNEINLLDSAISRLFGEKMSAGLCMNLETFTICGTLCLEEGEMEMYADFVKNDLEGGKDRGEGRGLEIEHLLYKRGKL